jgi:hypothetical protein
MGVNLGARVGAMRKRMGCRSGVHDLIILLPKGKFHGMSLELKVKGGHITPEQEDFQMRLRSLGYHSVIMPTKLELSEGIEWAKNIILLYLSE